MLNALLVECVQYGMTGAVGSGACPISHIPFGIFGRVPAKAALIDRSGLGAAEGHAEMLKLDDRRNRLAAHVFYRLLVAEPVGAPDRGVHVPAPIVLFHVSERRANATLRGDRVTARRKDLRDAGGAEPCRNHSESR